MRLFARVLGIATLAVLINPIPASAEWSATGPDGGEILDLWFDPLNDQRRIVITPLTGLFESTDGGASYQQMPGSPVIPELPHLLARPLRIVSAPGSPQTLFLGTGAQGVRSGVFRSDDGGNTWQEMNEGLGVDGNYPAISDLTSSLDGAVVYAATSDGVFASFDRISWVPLPLTERTEIIATSASNINRLYAASSTQGVFRTDDGGVSWAPINSGLGGFGTTAIAVDADPGERLFQASVAGQIDISDDLGESWTAATTGLMDAAGLARFSSIHAQNNSNLVFALSSGGGLFRSIDHGLTWTLLSIPTQVNSLNRLTSGNDGSLYLMSTSGLYISHDDGDSWTASHNGIRARAFDDLQVSPADDSWFTQSITLFRSSDRGANWVDIGEQLNRVNGTYAVSLSSANPGKMYAANSFNPITSADTGQTWSDRPAPGFGLTIRSWTDPSDDQTVIMADFGSGSLSLTLAGLYRSTDGGLSWTRTFEAPLDRINFQPHSVADDPTSPGTVFFGIHSRTETAFTDGLVLRSTDHGTSFEIVLDGMAFTQVIVDAGGHVYAAGTRDSKKKGVWRSTDGGESWQQYSNGLPNAFNTYDLAAHPTRAGHIFATDGLDIYESVNGGGSWYALEDIGETEFTDSLAVVTDPVHDYTLIAATRGNIFIGQDLAPEDPLAIPTTSRSLLTWLALAMALMACVMIARKNRVAANGG
ncbi:MAG: hypothetical protein DHS20C11_26330 [Lysobacteraceae bacterium]|nr:MAG: hypothetical protein DHS20C11_26330 [Xanthomonadaceae bacterium]